MSLPNYIFFSIEFFFNRKKKVPECVNCINDNGWSIHTTLLLLLLTGTIFSYFCMSSNTSVLILSILQLMIFVVIDDITFQ